MRKLPRSYYLTKWTSIGGVIGSIIIIIGAFISMLFFEGWEKEAFSPLNHFVSELGNINKSTKGGVFNTSVVIGGILFLPFIWGLGRHLNTPLGYFATLIGLITAFSLIGVGWFPGHIIEPHLIAAITFFVSGMLYTGLFSLAIILHKNNRLPKWLVVPGLFALACSIIFLAVPKASLHEFLDNPKTFDRPTVWLLPLMEWMVFVTMSVWIMLTSLNLRNRLLKLAER